MIKETILDKIKAGTTVRVFEKVKEGDKERLARFEGLILARKHGREPGASFTVRTSLAGIGVEKTYPIHSPIIEKVEIISVPKKVRRSKLYYVRDISRSALRRKVSADLKAVKDLQLAALKEREEALRKAKEEAAAKAKEIADKKAAEKAAVEAKQAKESEKEKEAEVRTETK